MASPSESAILVVATFPSKTGMARDEVVNAWCFLDADPGSNVSPGAAQPAVAAFYTELAVRFLSPELDLPAAYTTCYRLSGHLDGSPHGSPTPPILMGLSNTDPANTPLPQQTSVCLSYHANLTGVPEEGPISAIPNTAREKKDGAPATHQGKTRPAARQRGRLYLPPMNTSVLQDTGVGKKVSIPSTAFIDVVTAAAKVLGDIVHGVLTDWAVWSRVAAAAYPVAAGFVEQAWTEQRRRAIAPAFRAPFALTAPDD